MRYLTPLVAPFFLALAASLVLTPICRRLAIVFGVLDRPGERKIHGESIPMLGGLAIAAACAIGILVAGPWDRVLTRILLAGGLIVLLGIHEDRNRQGGLRWWIRLILEGVLALVVIEGGIRVGFLASAWIALPFALLWIVGITNAFNLLDNMNGLSAGVAAIASLTFAVLAARYVELGPEQLPTAAAAAALGGACLGFLPSNFCSRIFMGDGGSLFVGFTLACLAVLGSWVGPTIHATVIIPLLVLAYPIFDTTLVVFLRLHEGRSPVVGGRDHSSHRLVRLGLGRVETVLLIYLFCISHALSAMLISSVTFRLSLLALAGSASVLFIFGMVLRKAPPWRGEAPEETSGRGQENR
jgi:UDP-GlcNAc:undecaprenyl-phosphate GlcNAc-1-phosphate transferase